VPVTRSVSKSTAAAPPVLPACRLMRGALVKSIGSADRASVATLVVGVSKISCVAVRRIRIVSVDVPAMKGWFANTPA
jgi:hypothetical protein